MFPILATTQGWAADQMGEENESERGERIREMKEVVKIVQQIVVADACELHTPLNLWVNKGYFCRFYK